MDLRSSIYSRQWRVRQKLAAIRFGGSGTPTNVPLPAGFAPRKVLFILAGLIGDSVMSMAAIKAGRELWPEAAVTVLGKRQTREILVGTDHFDEFYEFDHDPFSLRRSGEVKQLLQWLANERFDLAIILLGDQFAHLLARVEVPIRVGTAGTPLEKCLTHTYEIGSPRTWGTNERLNAIRCLGYTVDRAVPGLAVDPNAAATARDKLRNLGLDEEDYIVLHPFGSTRRQWWNLGASAKFAEAVRERHDLETVLVGGPEAAGSIGSELRDRVLDSTGLLSLGELIAVIADAKVVVTTDSGPYHIAGALGRPIVGLFRARRPEHAGAYPTATVLFGKSDECMADCGWDQCATEPCRQMSDISVAHVLKSIWVAIGQIRNETGIEPDKSSC